MSIEFPTMFYRSPGPHAGKGITFDTIGVEDAAETVALLESGWVASYAELVEPKTEEAPAVPVEKPAELVEPKTKSKR